MAGLCPFVDGTSVYKARAIVRHYDTLSYSNPYEFNIPVASGSCLINSNTELNSSKEALSTFVYPNPANTEITITTDVDAAKCLSLALLDR